MASGRLAGSYILSIVSPSGATREVFRADANWFNVSGLGSPDAVMSTSATPDTLNFLPLSADAGAGGYLIKLSVVASTTDGFDISDSVAIIPINVDGNQQTIGMSGGNGINNNNFVADTGGVDGTATATQEVTVFTVRAKEGIKNFRIGGGTCFISVENDAA